MKKIATQIFNEDEITAYNNLKKLIEKRYNPTIAQQIRWGFESVAEFIIIIFAIPFLVLIKIFQIIFNRK